MGCVSCKTSLDFKNNAIPAKDLETNSTSLMTFGTNKTLKYSAGKKIFIVTIVSENQENCKSVDD